MKNDIFRKSSLERISSPEQLNDYIKVSNPSVWVIIAALTASVIAAFAWSIVGRIPTKLNTQAIFLKSNYTIEGTETSASSSSSTSTAEDEDEDDEEEVTTTSVNLDLTADNEETLVNPGIAFAAETQAVISNDYHAYCILNAATIAGSSSQGESSQTKSNALKVGQKVQISPIGSDPKKDGYIYGTIRKISLGDPQDLESLAKKLGTSRAQQLMSGKGDYAYPVEISLEADSTSKDKLKWSVDNPNRTPLNNGDICDAVISIEAIQPVSFIW